MTISSYFLLFGLWVRADPEDVLADLLESLLRRAFEAADAARLEVTFLLFRCDRAEPADDLADLLAPLLLRTLDAAVAARLLVCSLFFAVCNLLLVCFEVCDDNDWRSIV